MKDGGQMGEAIGAGDLVMVVHSECCAIRYVGMVLRVKHIHAVTLYCDCERAHFPLVRAAIFAHDFPYALPLSWLRKLPPASVLESIDIADELDAERPRETVTM